MLHLCCTHTQTTVDSSFCSQSISCCVVKCFGTEGRSAGEEVPGSDDVFELIIFSGKDIKDLSVLTEEASKPAPKPRPKPPMDPAIVSVSSAPPPKVMNRPNRNSQPSRNPQPSQNPYPAQSSGNENYDGPGTGGFLERRPGQADSGSADMAGNELSVLSCVVLCTFVLFVFILVFLACVSRR